MCCWPPTQPVTPSIHCPGGRVEAATYDAPDEEEAAIAKQALKAAMDGEDEDEDDLVEGFVSQEVGSKMHQRVS